MERKSPAANPLDVDDVPAFFGHIIRQLGAPKDRRCDNTLRHAREWCEANRRDWPAVQDWLQSNGGYCDCEVLMNVGPRLETDGAAQ